MSEKISRGIAWGNVPHYDSQNNIKKEDYSTLNITYTALLKILAFKGILELFDGNYYFTEKGRKLLEQGVNRDKKTMRSESEVLIKLFSLGYDETSLASIHKYTMGFAAKYFKIFSLPQNLPTTRDTYTDLINRLWHFSQYFYALKKTLPLPMSPLEEKQKEKENKLPERKA